MARRETEKSALSGVLMWVIVVVVICYIASKAG